MSKLRFNKTKFSQAISVTLILIVFIFIMSWGFKNRESIFKRNLLSKKPVPSAHATTLSVSNNPNINSNNSPIQTPTLTQTSTLSPTSTPNAKNEEAYNKAYNLFHSGNYGEAIKTADLVLNLDPTHYKAYNIKGIALSFQNKYQEGMQNIDKSLSIDPNYWYARFNKALAYEYHEMIAESLIWYDKSLEIENYVWSHYGKASCYGRIGDVKNAIINLKIAQSMDKGIINLAKKEKDFNKIRNTDEFKQFILNPEKPSTSSKLPILYYHAVSDSINGLKELFVSPNDFSMQMKYLADNNYDVITFDELKDIDKYKKPIIITFDDGYENNYTDAYPILKSHNFKAVIFLTYDCVDKNNFLKKQQIISMTDFIKFESHTLTHTDLTTLSSEKLEYELKESKNKIKDLTNQDSNTFAFPTGYYNSKVIDMVKKYYSYSVTNQSGLFDFSNNYEIKRVYIPRNTTIEKFKTRLEKGSL